MSALNRSRSKPPMTRRPPNQRSNPFWRDHPNDHTAVTPSGRPYSRRMPCVSLSEPAIAIGRGWRLQVFVPCSKPSTLVSVMASSCPLLSSEHLHVPRSVNARFGTRPRLRCQSASRSRHSSAKGRKLGTRSQSSISGPVPRRVNARSSVAWKVACVLPTVTIQITEEEWPN